jgi:hypothetical protein
MFFKINEEMLRRMQEQADKAQDIDAAEEDSQKFSILQGIDGSIIIDDPSLVKVIPSDKSVPSNEEINRTEVLTSQGWVSLRYHPFWRT